VLLEAVDLADNAFLSGGLALVVTEGALSTDEIQVSAI
jgi:hypothetical protein